MEIHLHNPSPWKCQKLNYQFLIDEKELPLRDSKDPARSHPPIHPTCRPCAYRVGAECDKHLEPDAEGACSEYVTDLGGLE